MLDKQLSRTDVSDKEREQWNQFFISAKNIRPGVLWSVITTVQAHGLVTGVMMLLCVF